MSYTRDGERLVAAAARKSLTRKPAEAYAWEMSEEEVEEWIRETLRRQHLSPWEHSVYTFSIHGVSRVLTHQLVRHRIASYTQLSMRYATARYSESLARRLEEEGLAELNVAGYSARLERRGREYVLQVMDPGGSILGSLSLEGGGGSYIVRRREGFEDPVSKAILESVLSSAGADAGSLETGARIRTERSLYARFSRRIDYVAPYRLARRPMILAKFIRLAEEAYRLYIEMLSSGIPGEDARYILPHGVSTSIVVTMNARELLHFFSLRTCTRAQWEIRALAWLMWREVYKVHPRLFKWAGPRCLYYENTVRDAPLAIHDFLGVDPLDILAGKSGEAGTGVELVSERCPEGVPRANIPRCAYAGLLEAAEAALKTMEPPS